MARDRRIGMIQPRADAGEPPPLFDVGCVGKIAEVEALDDGRYNIVLEGRGAVPRRPRARRHDPVPPGRGRAAAGRSRTRRCRSASAPALEMESRRFADAQGYAVDWEAVGRLDDESLVNGIAQIAPFDAAAKQALLEAAGIADRAELIVQLMQFFGRHDGDERVTLQ